MFVNKCVTNGSDHFLNNDLLLYREKIIFDMGVIKLEYKYSLNSYLLSDRHNYIKIYLCLINI